MIGIDTNVLVRYVAQDDAEQCKVVNELFEQASTKNKLFVSAVVIVESLWVLLSHYKITDVQARDFIRLLLTSKKVSLERSELFAKLIAENKIKAKDMADAIIASIAFDAGCTEFFTFDVKLKRLISLLDEQPQPMRKHTR